MGSYVTLQGALNGKYVSSEAGTAPMNCNRAAPNGWETFLVIDAGGGCVALQAQSNGKYVTGSSPMYVSGASIGSAQKFSWLSIHIWAITPQNEPENPSNTPSMTMGAAEQASFIQNYLGPRLRGAGYDTKIIGFDHNCDDTAYPTQVCRDASAYVDGSAFHLYAGPISALSTVHSSTAKNVYFTEQWTASSGSFGGDLAWHTENVTIGAANNWARAVIEWNLATDASFGPHTSGGCTQCQGALTVSGGAYARNVSYYIVAHLAKLVRPGALRVGTSSTSSNLVSAGFVNDRTAGGARALVVLNKGATVQSFNISYGSKIVSVRLNAGSVATYVWY